MSFVYFLTSPLVRNPCLRRHDVVRVNCFLYFTTTACKLLYIYVYIFLAGEVDTSITSFVCFAVACPSSCIKKKENL